ncbi:transposable element Tcb1 transposase [Trichonephila clavipes]|nr:transposable element Tcb1 transposase [Trichonephila clavipes]
MVWGCMSSHGVVRLHIVSGTVKAMDYIEILQNKLLPTARDLLGNQSWIFQDDNAPCHRAKVVQKWLEDQTVNRMNWSGQSPDLNPIENLWFKIGYEISNDEAHFWLNGYVNKQNCRIWSEANPQVYVETPLHPEKLTVWCALWAGGILLQKR